MDPQRIRPAATVSVLQQQDAASGEAGVALVLGSAALLAAVHLFAGNLRVLDRVPRSRWLSFASGVSVAYVFVHLLPELGEGVEAVEGSGLLPAVLAGRHVYLVALAGFTLFYGLERLVTRSRSGTEPFGASLPDDGVFWVHMGSFAAYNGLVGYLLHDQGSAVNLLSFTVAIGLHFVVNDYGLRTEHERSYHDTGRWVISGAVVVGALLGGVVEVGRAALAMLIAFLAGGIVLNVIKEELPEERESRWWAFAVGVVGYSAVLLLA